MQVNGVSFDGIKYGMQFGREIREQELIIPHTNTAHN